MSAAHGAVWSSLVSAARALCPPLEPASENPRGLALVLRDAAGRELSLRYRSERGLFLRTYFLVVEADVAGRGPAEPGELVLRRRRGVRWRRPAPRDAGEWQELLGEEIARAAKAARADRVALTWNRRSWRLRLETFSGGATATFFPPLVTPNPLLEDEASAVLGLLAALHGLVDHPSGPFV